MTSALSRYGRPALSWLVEKIHSDSWSSGASRPTADLAACLASSSLVEPCDPTVSPMDPDTSSTSSTFARLRLRSHDCFTAASTAGAGGPMTAFGSAGSIPSLWLMRLPALPSKSRNAASVKRFCALSDCT